MRKLLAISVCKAAAFIGRLAGRGSSLPGQLALKICPDIISRLRMDGKIAAVTGSNGKTSTVELVVRALEACGMTVCSNREGSNQIEGVATMLLRYATLGGRLRCDAVVLESDELYARHTFKHLTPDVFAVLNLFRDQMTRNGHPEFVHGRIQDAINPGMELILNADDPLVSTLACKANNITWFGIDDESAFERGFERYDDGAHCPVCLEPMEYSFRHFAALGAYECAECGFKRQECAYSATKVDMLTGNMAINGKYSIEMGMKTAFNAYNLLAAFAVARSLGADAETCAAALSNFSMKNGRVRVWDCGGKQIALLTSKHENSVSYNQSLSFAAARECEVLIIVDAVSRKYFTGETSWLWDISFELLAAPGVRRVYLAGKYVFDLAGRLDLAGVPAEKTVLLEELSEITGLVRQNQGTPLYVITCFSDREKFVARLPEGAREKEAFL